ncbi:MAG: class I SAM-dependent methyltransferase [Bacteriovoracaceae bacterium]|nr:class I SAM-dependent methyltransferase [Bacteriovoracaceae bacterium]
MSHFQCYAFNEHEMPSELKKEIQILGGEVVFGDTPSGDSYLIFQNNKLELTHGVASKTPLTIDYEKKVSELRGKLKEKKGPLAKSIGLDKRPNLTVVDGTLGMGNDSLLMNSWGVKIQGYERKAEVYLLNWFSLFEYNQNNSPSLEFEVKFGDIRNSNALGDVLYLDPMYPETRNKRLPKKGMQVLSELAGKDFDETEVFEWAMSQDFSRVVIKRPPKAEKFKMPTHSFASKSVRYDMYSFKQL